MKIKEYIHEILSIVLDINGIEERSVEKTGENPTVFFDFSGHVGNLYIRIYKNGWSEYTEPNYSDCIDLCAWNAEEELERTAKYLKSFRDDMLFLDDEHV